MKSLLLLVSLTLGFLQAFPQCQPIIIESGFPIIVNPQCGDNNGRIEVLAQGNGTIMYRLNSFPFQDSGVFDGLAPGNYTITMMDSAGCTEAIDFPLANQSEIIVNSVDVEDASCNADDGRIIVNAVGAGLTYSINGGAAQASNVFNNLSNGPYTITITDSNNCVEVVTAQVRRERIEVVSSAVVPADCPGNNGSINIVATGNGNVQYSINGTDFFNTGNFPGLAAGTYTVRLRDASGCTRNAVFVVNSDLNYTITTVPSNCEADNGEINIAVTSSGMFEFSINNGATWDTNPNFTGLPADRYAVRIRETTLGCLVRETIDVDLNVTLSNFAFTSTPADCGASNGTVNASATTTGTSITYTLNGVSNTTGAFTDLAAGTYTISLQDDAGCTIDEVVVVDENSTATINGFSQSNSDCLGATGSLTIDAVGAGNLTYTITYIVDGSMQTQVNDGTFLNLPGGTYDVTVTDDNSCTATGTTVVFENNDISVTGISATAPTNACSGDGEISITANGSNVMFSIDNVNFFGDGSHTFSGLNAGVYIIYMQNALGCTKQTGEIELTGQIEISEILVTDATCMESTGTIEVIAIASGIQYRIDNGEYGDSNMFTDLPMGDYTIWVRDDNNCEVNETVSVGNNGFAELTNVTATTTICGDANGSITIEGSTITGGMLMYSIDGTNFGEDNVFPDLSSGSYVAYVRDEFNCIDSAMIEVPESFDIEIFDVIVNNEQCDFVNGSIDVQATGGVGDLMYSLNGGTPSTTSLFTDLNDGDYTITVTDEVGCERIAMTTIGIDCAIEIPTAIAPNGNGVNEVHRLLYYLPIQIIEYRVYDRWGMEVFTQENFASTDLSRWWRGENADGQLIQDTYVYYLKYEFEGQQVEKEGSVMVLP